ncbi:MAG: ATP-grasp domain-containing protein [Streptomycetaceae bacterium]|nr:MAG: ATP-grasp domain-containing protein [Streptomycetaceae bacterium]
MFEKVLIANRGEVALRIHSTLTRLGITSVGIYTENDRAALHVSGIPESYLLKNSHTNGYLDITAIIDVAVSTGAQAIHPGYGFLAENPEFAQACHDAGLVFIGPTPDAMRAMGEKISAKENAKRAGVPVVPGIGATGMSNEEILEAAKSLDFPLLIKPAAGGGGKGLHVIHNLTELQHSLPTARREAKVAFGDENLLVEKYLVHARHIEFQIVADNHGNTMHLGERECSLQRRHQKVIEEAPAPLLSDSTRQAMAKAALALTSAIGYQNLGTVEFIVDAYSPEKFYFMEMNTRLQVEHRVTEMITGLDLVECQIRIAQSESLKDVIPDRKFTGHAIEARIYAEDAFNHFLPTGGTIGKFSPPKVPSTIIDSAISDGTLITTTFDPMLAKISCWGVNRETAIDQLGSALSHTVLLGVTTNIDFLIELLARRDFKESKYSTAYLESNDFSRGNPPAELLTSYASITSKPSKNGPWRHDGWRQSGSPSSKVFAYIDSVRYEIGIPNGTSFEVDSYQNDAGYWIHHHSFGTWLIKGVNQRVISNDKNSDEILSPMPGVVIAVNVTDGDLVALGDPLVVIEAMKMEHIVRAKRAGRVAACSIVCGTKVSVGQLLLEVVENV